jgi:hypothetical protein
VSLRYTLARPSDARLEVFDALGRRVAVVAAGRLPAGAHGAAVDASDLRPGVYVMRLLADGEVAVRTLVVR